MIFQHKESVLSKLKSLTISSRLCFSLACASRLFPICIELSSNDHEGEKLKLLSECLEIGWNSIALEAVNIDSVQDKLELVMAHIRKDSNLGTLSSSLKVQSEIAIAYMLNVMISGDVDEAAACGQSVVDAVYFFCKTKTKSHLRGKSLVDELFKQAELQLECNRQQKDLDDLAGPFVDQTIFEKVKIRAFQDRALPLTFREYV